MERLISLTISRDKKSDITGEPLLSISGQQPTQSEAHPPMGLVLVATQDLSSESGILTALRSDPPLETAVEALRALSSQSATSSQVIKCLLDAVLLHFWDSFSRGERLLLINCLDAPTGLSGCAGKVRILIPQVKDKEGLTADAKKHELHNLLSLIQAILGRSGSVRDTWVRAENETEVKRMLLWKEYTALIGSGRLLSLVAEAENSLGQFDGRSRKLWIANGNQYATWLGREIATAAVRMDQIEDEGWQPLCQLLSSSFRLGYTDTIVEECTFKLIHPENEISRLHKLLLLLASHDKRLYLFSLLRILSYKYLPSNSTDSRWWELDAAQVSGAACLLNSVIADDDDFKSSFMEWLTSTTGGGVGSNIGIRRAAVSLISKEHISFKQLFEKSLHQFADKLWIKHTPIMRQEVNVQILLLCVGYAHRHNPTLLKKLVRSPTHLNGISGRLGSSSERARFLGMVVGECCSAFLDEGDARLSFGVEETQTPEAMWWKSIPTVEDDIGNFENLSTPKAVVLSKKQKAMAQPATSAQMESTSSLTKILVEPDSESDDEFTPYANPDGDDDYDPPTEDATTIDRSAPKPPVYIRDLIAYLGNTTSYDHQMLALTHATPLIRRIADQGSSLSSELPTLLPLLTNLTNTFEIKAFEYLRLNALMSLTVSQPILAGQLLSNLFFTASYSLSRRATLLLSIGLAARELGGFAQPPPTAAPQAGLPARTASQWDLATSNLKRELLAPMASNAVAASAGPTILQTRVFSSRIAAESRRTRPAARPISPVAAEAFFYPLTGGWWVAARDGTLKTDPQLTATFLKTLAVVVHAAGPGAKGAVQMGRELWALALGLGVREVQGMSVVREAALVAVLAVLEVHDDGERVVQEMGREVVETREWVGRVVEEAEDGEERALAAGVLVRIQEVVGGWERRLMGEFGIEV